MWFSFLQQEMTFSETTQSMLITLMCLQLVSNLSAVVRFNLYVLELIKDLNDINTKFEEKL